MGVGMRITKEYGQSLTKGILNLLAHVGIIDRPVLPTTKTTVSNLRSEVFFVNASKPGIFIPILEHNVSVLKGEKLGEIIDPLSGTIQETIMSPCNGLLFTIREYPVVYEGSLLARILEDPNEDTAQ